jgi:hypothetical protein
VRTEIRAGTSARCSSIISSSGMLHPLPGYATIRRVSIERLCISSRRRGDESRNMWVADGEESLAQRSDRLA